MTLAREKLFGFAFLAFLFALPFGTAKFLFSFATPFSNYYTSEYTAAFLFGTDLLLLVVLAFFFFITPRAWFQSALREMRGSILFFALFIGFAALSLFEASYPAFGAYAFLRLLGALAAGFIAWGALRAGFVTFPRVAAVLGASAVFQAVVALLQFSLQKSVGVWWLGETVALDAMTPGIATFAAGGLSFVRAYGTMPHANILAGFLVLGVLALSFLFLEGERFMTRALAAAGLTLTLAGLVVTFSRSGWIVAACVFGALFVLALLRGVPWRRVAALVLVAFVSLGIVFGALRFAVIPRAHLSADESPVRDRWVMNEMGAALVTARPWGVGLGNQLFVSYDRGMFHKFGLTARGQWQPIHNLYLLVASEVGVVGLIAFLALVGAAFVLNLRHKDLPNTIAAILLLSLLLFGLMDHFLWDLEAGRLMLWVVLGILLGLGARSSTDRAYPSEG